MSDKTKTEQKLQQTIDAMKNSLDARCFRAIPPLLEEAEKLHAQVKRDRLAEAT